MKKTMKYILIFITTIAIFYFNIEKVEAVTIESVACDYDLVTPYDEKMTTIQIKMTNYNDGEGNPTFSYFYREKKDADLIEYKSPTYDFEYSQDITIMNNFMLRIFTMTRGKEFFLDNYKKSGKCPSIYVNATDSTWDVESSAINQNDKNSYKTIASKKELLKAPNGEWINSKDFYENSGVEVPEDRECDYNMYFDLYEINSTVSFTTTYNKSTGKPSYKVSVNGIETYITDFSTEVVSPMGLYGNGFVRIKADQLKKIFESKECLDGKNQICHYLNAENSTLGEYIISTDTGECAEKSTAGRWDNGDGSNDGQGGTLELLPEVGFGESMDCETLLGHNLTKIIELLITLLKFAGIILCIVKMMLTLIPPITSKDPEALNKAIRKCAILLVILVLIAAIRPIISFIAYIFGYDVAGCI